jgi:CRISPR-associated protein Csb1
MEAALQEALDGKRISLPVITVDFSKHAPTGDLEDYEKKGRLLDDVGQITSLQVPHRLADAILRDSESKAGVPFRKTDAGKLLNKASNQNATALYRYCPTALVFGMWDSTGPKGGLGAKFERAMVSEVIGFDAIVSSDHKSRGVRRDPLEARKEIPIIKGESRAWKVADDPKAKGVARPSEINHGSVPFDSENAGVTISHAEQLTTLSLIALRRLRFPVEGAKDQVATNTAAQTTLAALSVCASTLAFENGMGLRSRCLLWPEAGMTWEILAKPGEEPKSYILDAKGAIKLLADAAAEAKAAQLEWETSPIELKPSADLLELVRKSQQLAVKSDSED